MLTFENQSINLLILTCLIYFCSLVQTQKRIQNGLEVLQYYTTRKWIFHNDKIKKIHAKLNAKEKKNFFIDIVGLNWDQYILNYILGARKYCVHEEPHSIPKARRILQR